MPVINRETREWGALGTRPAAGREVYSPGEQPIASYDNWWNWAVSKDIGALDAALENHDDRHEAGGDDELDLGGLQFDKAAYLRGDTTTGAVSLHDSTDDSEVARFNLATDAIQTWPAFNTETTHRAGARIGGNLTRSDNGNPIYDYTTGKVPHAVYADSAGDADYATEAGNAGTVGGIDPSNFLRPGQTTATITGSWTFNQLINGSVTGNAATADRATAADTADFATEAGNSDTVDNYHAQDIIDAARSTGEWNVITNQSFLDPNTRIFFSHTSPTVYDRYRIEFYTENQSPDSMCWSRLWIQDDKRRRYYTQNANRWPSPIWESLWRHSNYNLHPRWGNNYQMTHVDVCDTPPDQWGYHVFDVTHPKEMHNVNVRYPRYFTVHQDDRWDRWSHQFWGELKTDYNAIDTLSIESTQKATGRIVMYGQDIGP